MSGNFPIFWNNIEYFANWLRHRFFPQRCDVKLIRDLNYIKYSKYSTLFLIAIRAWGTMKFISLITRVYYMQALGKFGDIEKFMKLSHFNQPLFLLRNSDEKQNWKIVSFQISGTAREKVLIELKLSYFYTFPLFIISFALNLNPLKIGVFLACLASLNVMKKVKVKKSSRNFIWICWKAKNCLDVRKIVIPENDKRKYNLTIL